VIPPSILEGGVIVYRSKSMELEVGVNCYLDVAYADELINSRLLSSSKEYKYWNDLDNNSKSIIILSTTEMYDVDSMGYVGIKLNSEQPLQFPRLYNNKIIECTDKIKLGYLLIGINENYLNSDDYDEISSLKANGVKTFKDGSGASIEFNNQDDYSNNCLNINNSIFNKYFKEYAHPNLSGFY
jgi:hypothetical protein